MNIVEKIKQELMNLVNKNQEKLGYNIWEVHVKSVVKNAVLLAKKCGADEEIVELAALLHDIARAALEGPNDEHHIYGAKIAVEMLTKYNYPQARIKRVRDCVLNHQAGAEFSRNTIEEECVADADALSHFEDIPGMFYLAYIRKGLSVAEGTEFVREKLKGDYLKLSEISKKEFKKKYENVISTVFVDK